MFRTTYDRVLHIFYARNVWNAIVYLCDSNINDASGSHTNCYGKGVFIVGNVEVLAYRDGGASFFRKYYFRVSSVDGVGVESQNGSSLRMDKSY